MEQIGQKYGVTRERVRQILRGTCGLPATDGGAAKRGQARKARLRSTRDARYLAKSGCTYDEYCQIRAAGGTRAWQKQKKSAENRAIEWHLSLREWWQLWQDSGKWSERGRGAEKYVMSRLQDSGPYAIGNVHIQTLRENSREAVNVWRGKTKEFKGVYFAYPGMPRPWIAKWNARAIGSFATQDEAVLARLSAQMRNEVAGAV